MSLKPYTTLIDFITGREVPNIGAEENRQAVERYLVEERGFVREDIAVDADIEISIKGERYRSSIDLVVSTDGGETAVIVIKCCAGSPASREREVVSAARLLKDYQVPFAIVSDAQSAIVLDTVSGAIIGNGMGAIPSKGEMLEKMKTQRLEALTPNRREKEKLIFRTYDADNINVSRNL